MYPDDTLTSIWVTWSYPKYIAKDSPLLHTHTLRWFYHCWVNNYRRTLSIVAVVLIIELLEIHLR